MTRLFSATTPSGFACHPSTGGELCWRFCLPSLRQFLNHRGRKDTEVRFLSLTREQKIPMRPTCVLWFRIRSSTRGRPGSRRSTLLVIEDGRAPAQFQTVTMPIVVSMIDEKAALRRKRGIRRYGFFREPPRQASPATPPREGNYAGLRVRLLCGDWVGAGAIRIVGVVRDCASVLPARIWWRCVPRVTSCHPGLKSVTLSG